MDILLQYFPDLTAKQVKQLKQLAPLYEKWNAEINVISRKDMDHFYERHVLHSLSIGLLFTFKSGSKILDIGTGGGFPGIPLAIIFPNVEFHLVDSIGKKIKVVDAVSEALGLNNVKTSHERAEKYKGEFDFIISRAVTSMPKFINLVKDKIKPQMKHHFTPGIIYLKGGDLTEEMKTVKQKHKIYGLYKHIPLPFFETKKIVHVNMI